MNTIQPALIKIILPSYLWSITGIGDVNADTQEDVVVGTANNEIHCFSGGSAFGVGIELWKVILDDDVWALSSINDINNDGCREVIAGTAGNKILCLSGQSGGELWRYSAKSDIFAVVRFSDMSQDGKDEVIAGGYGNLILCIEGESGNALWTFDVESTVWTLSTIEDLDGDGIRDILAGTDGGSLICLSGSLSPDNREICRFQAIKDIRTIKVSGDVLGDSFTDVFCGSADNYLYLCNGKTGDLIWGKNMSGELFSLDLVQDLTCDKKEEIICGTQMSSVHCLSGGNGRALWHYPFEDMGDIKHLASVPDNTGDDISEIIATSTNNIVVCLDGSAAIATGSCIIGDSDCDEKAGLEDALLTIQILSGIRNLSDQDASGLCELGDANHDGWVTLEDIILVLRFLSSSEIS